LKSSTSWPLNKRQKIVINHRFKAMNHFSTKAEIILYVHDQEISMQFYRNMLQLTPVLHVPGMTAFQLMPNLRLGLMPNAGIAKIIGDQLPHPQTAAGIPRCELYLYVDDIEWAFKQAVAAGAQLIGAVEDRDWGDKVCYFADPDGHILAFAKKTDSNP
jgi:predicted enzyme related to lactoylglutathione lyase